jgi:ADP-ribose pyrophosphatase
MWRWAFNQVRSQHKFRVAPSLDPSSKYEASAGDQSAASVAAAPSPSNPETKSVPGALGSIGEPDGPCGPAGAAGFTKVESLNPESRTAKFSKVEWDVQFDYDPPDFTAEKVLGAEEGVDMHYGAADAPSTLKVMESKLKQRKNAKRQTLQEAGIQFDQTSRRPLNPKGRTGLSGRGELSDWGPNLCVDPVVTRFEPITGQLQFLVVRRKDVGKWALPGKRLGSQSCEVASWDKESMADELRTSMEDMLKGGKLDALQKLMRGGRMIYTGYVDDPRNTDNAWCETTALHFHCDKRTASVLMLDRLDGPMRWQTEDICDQMYASHRDWVNITADYLDRQQTRWDLAKWCNSLQVHEVLAKALREVMPPGQPELEYVRNFESREQVSAELSSAEFQRSLLEGVVDQFWDKAKALREEAQPTGAALQAKYVLDGVDALEYQSLSSFYGGLEPKIGAPSPKVLEGMRREHLYNGLESHQEFQTPNYGVRTKSSLEWSIVVDPVEDDKNPGIYRLPAMRGAETSQTCSAEDWSKLHIKAPTEVQASLLPSVECE